MMTLLLELLNEYLSDLIRLAHEKRFIFHILEDFLSMEMYTNRKKAITKKVDSLGMTHILS